MAYPSSLDNFQNPTGASDLDTPAVLHSAQHANANDAIEALEAKVGIGASPALGAAAGDVLTADGTGATAWAAPTGGGATALDDLSDVDLTTTPPADGDRLAYDLASGLWLPTAGSGGGATVLDDLTDVDTTTTAPSDGDVLTFDSGTSEWVPAAPAAGGSSTLTITQQAADYTLVLADAGTEVEGTKATAQTITVPPNSSVAFPVGSWLNVRQYGAGQVTVAAGAGVTLRAPNGAKTAAQYSTLSLVKRATDEWVVSGDATT